MDINRFAAPVWSVFRAVIGLLFSLHGLASLFGLFGGVRGTGNAVEVGLWPNWYAAVIQLVCGLLVLAGLFTRPAAVLASGSMAYAYFVVHQPDGLMPVQNGGVAPALYSWTFLAIAVIGAGPWSLDAVLRRSPGVFTAVPAASEASDAPEANTAAAV